MNCPNCGSDRARRGGNAIWIVYIVLIALTLPAVLVLRIQPLVVAGVMLAVIVLAHLIINQRACLDCGHQWRGK